jgi:hypothetical protein
MQRQVERKRQLPAFTLSLGELEVLWSRVIERFDASADVYASITINLALETLSFSNPEELRHYSALPSKITNFRIYFSQNRHSISISSGLPSSWPPLTQGRFCRIGSTELLRPAPIPRPIGYGLVGSGLTPRDLS